LVDHLRRQLQILLICTALIFLIIIPSPKALLNADSSQSYVSEEFIDELANQISKEEYVALINLCNHTLPEDELMECEGDQAFLLKLYEIYMNPRPGVKLSFQIDPGFVSRLDIQLLRKILSALTSTQWRYTAGGWVRSSPSLVDINKDGKLEVLVGSNDTNLYCLSRHGSLLWKYKTDGIIESSPSIADIDGDGDLDVVVTSHDKSVYVLSKDGVLKWRFTTAGKISSSPAVKDIDKDGNLEVIGGSHDNRLYCLSDQGELEWSFTTEGRIVSSPAIGDLDGDGLSEIVFGSDDKHVYALNIRGRQLWKFETGDWVSSSAAIADLDNNGLAEVVIGSDDGNLYCLNYNGLLKWSYLTSREITQAVSIADVDEDGNLEIIFSSLDKNVYCLNPSGLLKWSRELPHSITSSFAIADVDGDGKLEILGGSVDNNLYCLSRYGVLEWTYPTDLYVTSTPAVADIDADGKLEVVFGSCDNGVYCLEEGFGEGLPWPMFQHDLHHTGTYGNNAPSCAVTYPNGGETVSGTINVCATAFDPNLGDEVVSVIFEYSGDFGTTWHEIGEDTNSPWSVSWDTTKVPEGELKYLVSARAFDVHAYSSWDQSDFFFTVGSRISLDPDHGRKGETVKVTGSGFTAGHIINLYWNAVKPWDGEKGLLNSTEVNAYGTYEVWFDVPEAVVGTNYVWVQDTGTGECWNAAFIVDPPLARISDIQSNIFNAPENSVYFVPTGNIYDDSALYAFYAYKENPQILAPPTQSSASSAYLDEEGSPLFTGNIVTFGGRLANRMVVYYEDAGIALVGYGWNGTHHLFTRISDGSHLYAVEGSTYIASEKDYFVFQVYRDGDRYIFSEWGICAEGTYAGGACFIDIIYPNLQEYLNQYYIYSWTDINNDDMPQSNEFSMLTSG